MMETKIVFYFYGYRNTCLLAHEKFSSRQVYFQLTCPDRQIEILGKTKVI